MNELAVASIKHDIEHEARNGKLDSRDISQSQPNLSESLLVNTIADVLLKEFKSG